MDKPASEGPGPGPGPGDNGLGVRTGFSVLPRGVSGLRLQVGQEGRERGRSKSCRIKHRPGAAARARGGAARRLEEATAAGKRAWASFPPEAPWPWVERLSGQSDLALVPVGPSQSPESRTRMGN